MAAALGEALRERLRLTNGDLQDTDFVDRSLKEPLGLI
jgi:hypothetical protein